MLRRDVDRFEAAGRAAATMPLGSGRPRRAQLGARPRGDGRRARLRGASPRTRSTPSPTATSRSTTCRPRAICATHLSRIGAEIVLWSTSEFGFCRPAEDYSSGSSIMPQKMNPDAAELLRAKAPRVVASYATAERRPARRCRSPTPRTSRRTRSRSSTRSTRSSSACSALDGMLGGITFDREAMADGGGRRDGRRDRRRRPARPPRDALPRGPRRRRRARPPRARAAGSPSRRSRPRELGRLLGAARRRVLRGARRGRLARLEGLARRHLRRRGRRQLELAAREPRLPAADERRPRAPTRSLRRAARGGVLRPPGRRTSPAT